jgi:RNA polymerase sigma factor (sigma-70 family)
VAVEPGQGRDGGVRARLAETFRLESARVVAAVLRIVRDIDAAEEIVQEAFARALDHWPAAGEPARPGAWLLTAARRRALDHLRRLRRAGARAGALAYEAGLDASDEGPEVTDPETIPDDRLRLIFTCCHPGLPPDSRVALTLRLVGGLTTAEIARAFLTPEATVAQRLVRAKRTIRERAFPYEVPGAGELAERLPAVLAVVYLVFNEGYAAHSGDELVRHDLCEEAIRLGRMLAELMPDEPEVLGLLALMQLQASRAATRADADGNLILLADQDRARWDRARIAEGLACLARAGAAAGPYQLQAAIAACHARAPSWESTDWPGIVEIYDALSEIAPSPVVALNRAVAVGLARGPEAGLAALDAIESAALRDYHLLPSARADFLRRLGRLTEAAREYRRALGLTDNAREQRFLASRLADCEAGERR